MIDTPMQLSSQLGAFFSATLPLPPSVNASYKIIGWVTKMGKHAHKLGATPELEQFKINATYLLNTRSTIQWSTVNWIQQSKEKIPLFVSIRFYFPTLWLKDVDGGIKSTLDVCFTTLALNDHLVTDLYVSKRTDRNNPRVEVKITALPMEA